MSDAWLSLIAAIGGGFGAGSGFLMFVNRKLISSQELNDRLKEEKARTQQEHERAEKYEQEILRLNGVHVDRIMPSIENFTIVMKEQTSLLRQFFESQIRQRSE